MTEPANSQQVAPYEYSYTQEQPLGQAHFGERVAKATHRYRGRCSCGRQTHQTYSSAATALTAIRFVHNPDIPGEEHAR